MLVYSDIRTCRSRVVIPHGHLVRDQAPASGTVSLHLPCASTSNARIVSLTGSHPAFIPAEDPHNFAPCPLALWTSHLFHQVLPGSYAGRSYESEQLRSGLPGSRGDHADASRGDRRDG